MYVKNTQPKTSCSTGANTDADEVPCQEEQGDLELLHGHIFAHMVKYYGYLLHQQVCHILCIKLIVSEIHFSGFSGTAPERS